MVSIETSQIHKNFIDSLGVENEMCVPVISFKVKHKSWCESNEIEEKDKEIYERKKKRKKEENCISILTNIT